eukprot:m.194950 g.194950  ORF g.194950 m.194950 type:complete len:57 (+) comp19343_c0_seq1:74-244(+)
MVLHFISVPLMYKFPHVRGMVTCQHVPHTVAHVPTRDLTHGHTPSVIPLPHPLTHP